MPAVKRLISTSVNASGRSHTAVNTENLPPIFPGI
jgi:hypothetical protein